MPFGKVKAFTTLSPSARQQDEGLASAFNSTICELSPYGSGMHAFKRGIVFVVVVRRSGQHDAFPA